MSISRLLIRINQSIDCWDPYGYGRLMGVKGAYLTIIFFVANLLFKAPHFSVLVMMVAASSVMMIEMPSMNDYRMKDLVYLGYTAIVIVTIILFDLLFYLKVWFILIASVWCYCLYRLLARKPQLFPVVSIVLLLGLMSMESYPTSSLNEAANNVFYFIESAIIGFWAHKLFPNFYFMIYKKTILRQIEALVSGQPMTIQVNHRLAMRNVQSLLYPRLRQGLDELEARLLDLSYCACYIRRQDDFNRENYEYCYQPLQTVIDNIKNKTSGSFRYDDTGSIGPPQQKDIWLAQLSDCCARVQTNWGALCKQL